MSNYSKLEGFEATGNFTLKKSINVALANGSSIIIENIPVLISHGAQFAESYTQRTENSFCFHPRGIISTMEEKFTITKEELDYFVEKKLVKIL
jgi:hypothetical protein